MPCIICSEMDRRRCVVYLPENRKLDLTVTVSDRHACKSWLLVAYIKFFGWQEGIFISLFCTAGRLL